MGASQGDGAVPVGRELAAVAVQKGLHRSERGSRAAREHVRGIVQAERAQQRRREHDAVLFRNGERAPRVARPGGADGGVRRDHRLQLAHVGRIQCRVRRLVVGRAVVVDEPFVQPAPRVAAHEQERREHHDREWHARHYGHNAPRHRLRGLERPRHPGPRRQVVVQADEHDELEGEACGRARRKRLHEHDGDVQQRGRDEGAPVLAERRDPQGECHVGQHEARDVRGVGAGVEAQDGCERGARDHERPDRTGEEQRLPAAALRKSRRRGQVGGQNKGRERRVERGTRVGVVEERGRCCGERCKGRAAQRDDGAKEQDHVQEGRHVARWRCRVRRRCRGSAHHGQGDLSAALDAAQYSYRDWRGPAPRVFAAQIGSSRHRFGGHMRFRAPLQRLYAAEPVRHRHGRVSVSLTCTARTV